MLGACKGSNDPYWGCCGEGGGGGTERFVAATDQTAAAERARSLGWGRAVLGREPMGAMRNGGACYTGSMSADRLPELGGGDRRGRRRGGGLGIWGCLGVAKRI